MNKNLSIILKAAGCAALIAAAGLSQSSAQQEPKQPDYSPSKQQGQMQGQSKGTMPGQEPSRTTMERATDTAAGNLRMVTVTVKEVDRASHMVTFQAKVSPEANIRQNGQPIQLDQLQEGDSLRVAFDPRTGEVMRAEVLKKARQ